MVRRIIFLIFLPAGILFSAVYFCLTRSFFWKLQRVNIVVFFEEQKQPAILSLSQKESGVYLLPSRVPVAVGRGFGEYELGKVFPLGEMENKGGQLLAETVRENYRLPVFGYISSRVEDLDSIDSLGKIKLLLWRTLRKKNKTDLAFGDLLILFLKTAKSGSFKKFDNLEERSSGEFFADSEVREEAVAVEILNGTFHDGLAQRAAEMWERIGGRVVRVADSQQKEEGFCKIIFRTSVKNSYSYWFMSRIFSCSQEELGETGVTRTDLSLIVGEGYWKILTEKW